MKQTKFTRFTRVLIIVFGFLLSVYFFILPFDYQIRFTTKQAPLTIYNLLHKRVDKVAFVDDEIRFREVSNGENFCGQ